VTALHRAEYAALAGGEYAGGDVCRACGGPDLRWPLAVARAAACRLTGPAARLLGALAAGGDPKALVVRGAVHAARVLAARGLVAGPCEVTERGRVVAALLAGGGAPLRAA
jgi:hypothetical protein